jgi:hypothetical protein
MHITCKSQSKENMNTLEKYKIYKTIKQGLQLNDAHTQFPVFYTLTRTHQSKGGSTVLSTCPPFTISLRRTVSQTCLSKKFHSLQRSVTVSTVPHSTLVFKTVSPFSLTRYYFLLVRPKIHIYQNVVPKPLCSYITKTVWMTQASLISSLSS